MGELDCNFNMWQIGSPSPQIPSARGGEVFVIKKTANPPCLSVEKEDWENWLLLTLIHAKTKKPISAGRLAGTLQLHMRLHPKDLTLAYQWETLWHCTSLLPLSGLQG